MRKLLIIVSILYASVTYAQDLFELQDAFFKSVVVDGKVDYAEIKKNRTELDARVKEIGDFDLSNKRVTADFLKAFYVNAYNILVIKQVVDLYPIEGPLAVDGFFDKIENTVMGEQMTLNQLEKETLYKQFPDPRLHFVLVCAADGCPPIANYSYSPLRLDEQLSERTTYVLDLDWFVKVNKKAELSQIFEWYQGDFTKNGSIIEFINEYRTEKINSKMKTTFYPYMWSLNSID